MDESGVPEVLLHLDEGLLLIDAGADATMIGFDGTVKWRQDDVLRDWEPDVYSEPLSGERTTSR